MKKLLNFLASIGITTSSAISVVACKQPDKKIDLENYQYTNLEIFDNIPTDEQILKLFNQKSQLNLVLNKDVLIKDITKESATIVAQPGLRSITGSVKIKFQTAIHLEDFTKTSLGEFNEEDSLQAYLDRFNSLNNTNLIMDKDVELRKIESKKIIRITGIWRTKWKGSVEATYTYKIGEEQKDIYNILQQPEFKKHRNNGTERDNTLMGMTHAPTLPTKYFVKRGSVVKLKWKVDGYQTYAELIKDYPEYKEFYFGPIIKGRFWRTYDLKGHDGHDNGFEQKIFDNGKGYNQEMEFTVENDGILQYRNFPWIKNKVEIQVLNENEVLQNYYLNDEQMHSEKENENFWTEMIKQAKKQNYSADDVKNKNIIPDKPFIILDGDKYFYVIQTKRFWAHLNYLMIKKKRNFENHSLSVVADYFSKVRTYSDEAHGLGENYLGMANKDNYKIGYWDNDSGAGGFYAGNEMISLHGRIHAGWQLPNEPFYPRNILSQAVSLTKGKTVKDGVNGLLLDQNWGLYHETGHTYQNPKYKLSWWGEVTENINTLILVQKGFREALNKEQLEKLNYSWLTSWSSPHSQKLFNNWRNGNYGYFDNYSAIAEQEINKPLLIDDLDMGGLLWLQLITSFGENFFPMLNQYYRIFRDELDEAMSKDYEMSNSNQQKLDILMRVIAKITHTNFLNYTKAWHIRLSQETIKIMENFGADQSQIMLDNLFKNKWTESVIVPNAATNLKDFAKKVDKKENYIQKNLVDFGIYDISIKNVMPNEKIAEVKVEDYKVILKEDDKEFYNSFTYSTLDKKQKDFLVKKMKYIKKWNITGTNRNGIDIQQTKDNKLIFSIIGDGTKAFQTKEDRYVKLELLDKNGKLKDQIYIAPDQILNNVNFKTFNYDKGDSLRLTTHGDKRSNYFDNNSFSFKNLNIIKSKIINDNGIKYSQYTFEL